MRRAQACSHSSTPRDGHYPRYISRRTQAAIHTTLTTILQEGGYLVTDTYVFADDRAQRINPHNSCPAYAICEQTLTTEHSLAELLRLQLLVHAFCARQKCVFAHCPDLAAI